MQVVLVSTFKVSDFSSPKTIFLINNSNLGVLLWCHMIGIELLCLQYDNSNTILIIRHGVFGIGLDDDRNEGVFIQMRSLPFGNLFSIAMSTSLSDMEDNFIVVLEESPH